MPLSQDELEEMVYWTTELNPVFRDAVDQICIYQEKSSGT